MKQMHDDQTKQIRQITMNQEGPQEQEGGTGAGADGGPQGRLAISLSGGGPTGLGLLSLAFPSNIMTLVWRRGGGEERQD